MVTVIRTIVEAEPLFPDCEKRFLLNRIVDEAYASRITVLIETAGYVVEKIPFVLAQYQQQRSWEDKVRYVTNLNSARNLAVKNGLRDAPIVLPFDSGCCFDNRGWQAFVARVKERPDAGYYAVPMQRISDPSEYAQPTQPRCTELNIRMEERLTEPQLVLTRKSDQFFNEALRYGYMPKAELLIRLDVKGPWLWFAPKLREQAMRRRSQFFGAIPWAGYVYRLPCTEETSVETHGRSRAEARVRGVAKLIRQLEARLGTRKAP